MGELTTLTRTNDETMKNPLIAPEEIERYSRSNAKITIFFAVLIAIITGIFYIATTIAYSVDYQNVYMDVK